MSPCYPFLSFVGTYCISSFINEPVNIKSIDIDILLYYNNVSQHTFTIGSDTGRLITHALAFLKPRIERHGTTQLGDADVLLNDTDAGGGQGLQCFGRTDISIENGQRNGKSTHRVRDVDYAADAPLTRAAAQKEVDLFLRIAKLAEIFDALQHGLLVL